MTPIQRETAEPFADRRDAGRQLAERLLALAPERPVVLALPRGGVPVAEEIADAIGAPLEVLVVRKLGAPHNPEYGIGAVAEDDVLVVDMEAVSGLGVSGSELDALVARETAELQRRVAAYRGERSRVDLAGRTAIVVDDGIATGVTDTAALRSVRHMQPRRTVLAVPVCSHDAAERLRSEADGIVCLRCSSLLGGVGSWYHDFTQVSDAEVVAAMRAHGDGGVRQDPSSGEQQLANSAPRG